MAAPRTHDEILDQLVYAIQLAFRHYGPGFSADGLQGIRKALGEAAGLLWCDTGWTVDIPDGEEIDYHPSIYERHNRFVETFEECREKMHGRSL